MSLLLRTMRVFDGERSESLFFRGPVGGQEDKKYYLAANCSDTFYWGTADVEEITEENISILEQTKRDLEAIGQERFTADLFSARIRKMRPQGAVYNRRFKNNPELCALFDACGPSRDTGLTNPHPVVTVEESAK